MIFKFLLSLSLFFVLIYAVTQKSKSFFASTITLLCAAAGLYFVWIPEHATVIAHFIGVGRGADLIFYCWVLISMSFLLNLHFKVRSNVELITALARRMAILEAERSIASEQNKSA